MKYTIVWLEVWSNTMKAWVHNRNFDTREAAEKSRALWERDGYKARVCEREFSGEPDFVNSRGE